MPTILVLGGEGMLGHKMFQRLRERFAGVWCTMRSAKADVPIRNIDLLQSDTVIDRVDVADWTALMAVLDRLQPDVVVNCVGIIKQRQESKAAIPSIAVNALLPHQLAHTLADWGGRLIHFSTDCVFSGRRGRYVEQDVSDADDLYGRTKYLGEVASPDAVTLRTSMIGRELSYHESLLDWFLKQNHGTVRGYRRSIFSGVTTIHLADVVADLVANHGGVRGLYHVASGPISKHDLLYLLKDAYGLDVEIVPDDTVVCDRSLIGDRFNAATGYRCPPWPALIDELASDPTPYEEWLGFP